MQRMAFGGNGNVFPRFARIVIGTGNDLGACFQWMSQSGFYAKAWEYYKLGENLLQFFREGLQFKKTIVPLQ